MLYFCKLDESTLITHDGCFQLGIFHMSKEKFINSVDVEYTEVYWIPDVVGKRYKSKSYQNHLRTVGQLYQ